MSSPLLGQAHKAPPADWEIEAQVQKALHDDHIFVGSSIMFSVDKGVVKLTGIICSETEKEYASSDLAKIPGLKTVLNDLEVPDISFHPAPTTAKVAGAIGPKTLTLVAGRAVPVRLTEAIETKTAEAGGIFHATTASNVTVAGYTAVPAGTPVTGRIVEAKAAGRVSGSAELGIELVSVRLSTGTESQDVAIVTQELSGRGGNTVAKTGGGGAGADIRAASGGALGLGATPSRTGRRLILSPKKFSSSRPARPWM